MTDEMPKRKTRDPARIEPMLDAIREKWTAHPDLRLTQLILNGAWQAGARSPSQEFQLEDDLLLRGIRGDFDRRPEE